MTETVEVIPAEVQADPDAYERIGEDRSFEIDVVFDWRLSRRHGEATRLLAGFRGVLQSDAYPASGHFARGNPGVEVAGCWADARRRFHEALKEAPTQAGFTVLQAHRRRGEESASNLLRSP